MNWREIQAFMATAEKGSFLRAATELHTSAVSVMKQVNSLENFTGVKLLERTPRGARLTPAGESFRNDMKDIITMTDNAVHKAREISRSECYTVRIGTSLLRPCKPLTDILAGEKGLPFRIDIVPFDDPPSLPGNFFSSADCFVSPCDSSEWREKYNILILGKIPCRIAVPREHKLAGKAMLLWNDLDGEKLMLVRPGVSPVLDGIRQEIMTEHESVRIADIQNLYDVSIFNECVKSNCLMETLDIWSGVHPSLVTVPMQWEYVMPFGVIYPKNASRELRRFIAAVEEIIS